MSNQNPVRRHSADAMTDRQKMKFPVYVKRQRQPGEALPYASSAMSPTNVYQQTAWVAPVR